MSVETTLSRNKIAFGETVTITYHLNKSTLNISPNFAPLEKYFHILGTNYRTSLNIFNGGTQSETTWEVTVEPKITGDLSIPEITFGDSKSSASKLVVTGPTNSLASANTKPDTSAFVSAELNTTKPYVQSQVVYTFKLFYRTDFENPRIELPHIDQGKMMQMGDDKTYQTTIKGERFLVLEKNFAFFPSKPGQLVIPPIRFHALQFNNNSTSINEPFPFAITEPITLNTKAFTLDVQKIPANIQTNIWLPAKNISITEHWSTNPDQWEIGNPINRTITIRAEGLRADQIPDLILNDIAGVNIYKDPPHRNNAIEGNSLVGIWQQKITYIPNQLQSFTIPAFNVPWWNIKENKNALAQLPAITVNVQGKMNEETKSDINPITTSTPSNVLTNITKQMVDANQNKSFYGSIWFWIALFLLILWLLTLWRMRKTNNSAMTPSPSDAKSKAKSASNLLLSAPNQSIKEACEKGNPHLAQKLILQWAKKNLANPPQNLGQLRNRIDDDVFKKALENLEQAIYADIMIQWDGHSFFEAYVKVQKYKEVGFKASSVNKDPLPPLNP